MKIGTFVSVNQSLKSMRHWISFSILLLLVFGILVVIENISHLHNIRLDLTRDGRYSLSPQSIKLFNNLAEEVKITVFYESGDQIQMRNNLSLYSAGSSKIIFQLKDLDRNPGEAKRYGIRNYGETVIEYKGKKKIVSYPTEENIVSAILDLIRDEKRTIFFLKGHGENDTLLGDPKGHSQAKRDLESEGYETKDLWLMRERIPPRTPLIIISGPKKDLSLEELIDINQYVQNGGRLLWMIDPDWNLPNINSFLERYGILLEDSVIVDKENRLFGGDFLTPIIHLYREHSITKDFNIPALFAVARAIEIKDAESGTYLQVLALSSPGSWAVKDRKKLAEGNWDISKEKRGPHPVAVIASVKKRGEQPGQGRMAVFGDSDFINNFYVKLYGNRDLFLNTINWLTESETLISIRSTRKEYSFMPLKPSDTKRLFWPSVVVEPGLILAIGIIIFVRRKLN